MAKFVTNQNLDPETDVLYHFGLHSKNTNYKKQFGDVKFVCCGGTAERMLDLAQRFHKVFTNDGINVGKPMNLSLSERFVLYKVGPVLCVNHGIGFSSISVMLNELFKLLHYAECVDIKLFRCGTAGGLGVEPGTLVISNQIFNGGLESYYEQFALGKLKRNCIDVDSEFAQELCDLAKELEIPCCMGATMSTDCFYQAQGRSNGAFCDFSEDERMEFLKIAHSKGVRNFEMEACCLAAMANRANIKFAIVCGILVNRLESDVIDHSSEQMKKNEHRPLQLLIEYITRNLS